MQKVIVFSGHGRWDLGDDEFVSLPAKCAIKFYTMNAKLLSDGLGGSIDRGFVTGLEPDQEAGPFKSVPDMRLFPPTGLNIRTPSLSNWHVLKLPCRIPVDRKNIQIQIDPAYPGGASLSVLFSYLDAAIRAADSVQFLWAACREVKLKDVGGRRVGVNVLGR